MVAVARFLASRRSHGDRRGAGRNLAACRIPTRRDSVRWGGRGRTGTALACLAVLDGVPHREAVAYVREHYCVHAVETPWQRRFVLDFR